MHPRRIKITQNTHGKPMPEWFPALSDYLIANPTATNPQIGRYFNRHPTWISIVRNSDLFTAYFSKRIAAHQSKLSDAIISKATSVTLNGLTALDTKIAAAGDTSASMKDSDLIGATSLASKILGFGVNKVSVEAPITINSVGIDRKLLEQARQKLLQVSDLNTKELNDEPITIEASASI